MSLDSVAFALLLGGLALLVGAGLRRLPGLRRSLVPGSVLGGLALLLVGPRGILGALGVPAFGETVHGVLRALPAHFIDVVFASILLGRRFEAPRRVLRLALRQAAFGQTLAWGQYAVGLGLTLLVLRPLLGVPAEAGVLIEMSFQGGHGIAAGMRDAFSAVGFADGPDLSGALATLGLLGGLFLGARMVARFRAEGRLEEEEEEEDDGGEDAGRDRAGDEGGNEREGRATRAALGIDDPVALPVGLLALSVGLGAAMKQGLVALEAATWAPRGGPTILAHVPRFPLAMIGSVIVNGGLALAGVRPDRRLVERLGGLSLDLTVATAIAGLAPGAIGALWVPFLVLGAGGTLWCLLAFRVLARPMLGRGWRPRGLADFGQSMGMTAAGLLLAKMADPSGRSRTREAFGTKQLFFEPFVGGGLVTSAALPAVHHLGALPCLVASVALTGAGVALGLGVLPRLGPPDERGDGDG